MDKDLQDQGQKVHLIDPLNMDPEEQDHHPNAL
jgi:hypothetical protein